MTAMSVDHLVLTPNPYGVDEVIKSVDFLHEQGPCTLTGDETSTMLVVIRDSDRTPLVWFTMPRPVADHAEICRLLPTTVVPPGHSLPYWSEVHSSSYSPNYAATVARSLADAVGGWTSPLVRGAQ